MTQGGRSNEERVAVLDRAPGQSLAGSVRAAGMTAQEVYFIDELEAALKSGECRLAVIAFESLWPDPQATLRRLRESARGARLVVVYPEGTPRLRLGRRLWSA